MSALAVVSFILGTMASALGLANLYIVSNLPIQQIIREVAPSPSPVVIVEPSEVPVPSPEATISGKRKASPTPVTDVLSE